MDASRSEDRPAGDALARWGSPVSTRPGRAVFLQGDPADHCWFLVAGRVTPIRYRADDSRLTLEEAGAGAFLGLAECLLGRVYQYDALTVERCDLLRIGRGNLERLIESGEAAAFLLRALAGENLRLHGRLDAAGVGERIAAYLLSRAEGNGETRVVRATQESVARAVGAARETVNRRLQDLEREGILETGRGEILVYRPEALARLAGGI